MQEPEPAFAATRKASRRELLKTYPTPQWLRKHPKKARKMALREERRARGHPETRLPSRERMPLERPSGKQRATSSRLWKATRLRMRRLQKQARKRARRQR